MKKPNILRKIITNYRIRKYLNPFLNLENERLGYFQVVRKESSPKLDNLITVLKRYAETYQLESSAIDKLEKDREYHNQEVEKLKKYQFKTDTSIVYKNPTLFNKSEFDDDWEVSKAYKKYKDVDRETLNKADEIIRLVDNYALILQEYQLKNEYLRIVNFSDIYYDSRLTNELLTRVQRIKNQLADKELFYDFPLLDEDAFLSNVSKHNSEYIQKHLHDVIFDDVLGRSLDIEQRTAVLKDETSALTIAGAGSGKTLTICGKLKFLLNAGIKPSEILLLSYSKKSAEDLNKKAKLIHPELNASTFHKLGLNILRERTQSRYVVEEQYDAIIESYFRDELKKDPAMMKMVLQFYSLFLNPYSGPETFANDGELYKKLKAENFQTLKDTLSNISGDKENMRTIKKELVKSIEELDIANFYFLNGINYTYEKPYKYDVSDENHRQYTPDFFLDDYNLYHEHYGVDKNGKARQYDEIRAKKYEDGIEWKRKIHAVNKTKYIESFSYEFSDGTIFDKLTQTLNAIGVELHPLSEEEIKNAIDSIYNEKPFKGMITLCKSFLSLYKGKYSNTDTFEKLKNTTFKSNYDKVRATVFLDICKSIYTYYRNYLQLEGKIDFDDMILQSKDELRHLNSFKYRYIIVDEFQDISYSRMEFLKSLLEHGKSKLFAVGDDWQAIYRFSGCDLGIFLNFENQLGKSAINYITSTHRNSQELQDVAGEFIRKNPQQMVKSIHSEKRLDKPIKILYFTADKQRAFDQALSLISNQKQDANILVLGRNNKDLEDVLSYSIRVDNSYRIAKNPIIYSRKYPNLNVHYSTVHSSKGLEEDYTIIINGDDDLYGFPNKMEDDQLLSLVLSEPDKMVYAEERRLWYVALTRTRSYCYILTNELHPSIFVKEIKDKCELLYKTQDEKEDRLCPDCKSGKLILRKGNRDEHFYGCSNYPYCNYTIANLEAVKENLRCPSCGDFLIKKDGKYGEYYYCHNYHHCHYRINANRLKVTSPKINQ